MEWTLGEGLLICMGFVTAFICLVVAVDGIGRVIWRVLERMKITWE